ncbi:MAG: hypothetical protein GF308_02195 [Candidatus Heimdallarchaeota archaeon]|nr:hypothetical protein [Candidatus Heimdallarchaeota archaeon]
MVFASRSKFFWSRFIATCVKHLQIANTQHIKYLAEKLLPTEMSRQNILYHVRIAEEKGWIATFASSLELTKENEIIFRKQVIEKINEKISAQRFVVIGTRGFEETTQEKIKEACDEIGLEPLTILDKKIRKIVTESALKRAGSLKKKNKGRYSLFMVLLRLGWLWLSDDPTIANKIVENLKRNFPNHSTQGPYKLDITVLELVGLLETDTTPELWGDGLKALFNDCIPLVKSRDRKEIMNLMAMILIVAGRYLVIMNKLFLAEECLNRGIKYLRLCHRESILMRKMQVDGLFSLAFIYAQQGWFYKALGLYENIERIINEEFTSSEPVDNMRGQLSTAKAELYLMMAWPSYTYLEDDYRNYLLKSIKSAKEAIKYYKLTDNKLRVCESYLFAAWGNALVGKMRRAENLLNHSSQEMTAPIPPRINGLYFNVKAELYRKEGDYNNAIHTIEKSFDYFRLLGYVIGKLFIMTRMATIHVNLTQTDQVYSFISYGNISEIFEEGNSDMISHVLLEFNKKLAEQEVLVSFYVNEELFKDHPEIISYAEIIDVNEVSPALLRESFTILPKKNVNLNDEKKGKVFCIVGPLKSEEFEKDFPADILQEEFAKFDELFQELLQKSRAKN